MKITFEKPKISVVNNKIVIYKLPWKVNFGYNEGNSKVRNAIINTLENIVYQTNKFKLSGIFTGKAVCDKSDTFNYDFGVAIAESKAKQKAYKMAYRLADFLEEYLDTALCELNSDTHNYLYHDEIQHEVAMIKHSEQWIEHRKEVRRKRKCK